MPFGKVYVVAVVYNPVHVNIYHFQLSVVKNSVAAEILLAGEI